MIDMGKIIFIVGGARSGKSGYAMELAKKLTKKVAFIATATAGDTEMKERIRLHKARRPRHWKLIEESRNIYSALTKLKGKYEVVLVDCLGFLISNYLSDKLGEKEIKRKVGRLMRSILRANHTTILVSNDVGSGVVPVNSLARRFRDELGFLNQMMAKKADEVIVMQSGIPVMIKGEQKDAKIK